MISRIARKPIIIPKGVSVTMNNGQFNAKGSKGEMGWPIDPSIKVVLNDEHINIEVREQSRHARAMSGTTHALISNMLTGVHTGFTKKLLLVGVGYRAQKKGNDLNMSLGFSHPVVYSAPKGISFELPSQTEIIVAGIDKQLVGQTAAEIRAYRPPEPYKGKGVRYDDEVIVIKETKK